MEKEWKIEYDPEAIEDLNELLDAGKISALKAIGQGLNEVKEALTKGLPLPPNVQKAVSGYDEQLIRTMNSYSGKEIIEARQRKSIVFPLCELIMEDVWFLFLDARTIYRDEEISFDKLTGYRFLSVDYVNGYKIHLSLPDGTENIVIEVQGHVYPPLLF